MAYFANGTEGAILEEQCGECLHGAADGLLCPVAAVQLTYNYDQCDNEELATAMNLLINEQGECLMKRAMGQAGIKLDLSGRDQMSLLERS